MNTNRNKFVKGCSCLFTVVLFSVFCLSCSAQTRKSNSDYETSKDSSANTLASNTASQINTASQVNCGQTESLTFPDKKENDLHKAAATLNVAGIKAALKKNIDVNEKDSYGNTALIIALTQKIPEPSESKESRITNSKNRAEAALKIAELLLQRRADVNTKGFDGKTALIRAVLADESIVSKLLNLLFQYKADINFQDNQGYTSLMEAARTNRIKAAEILLAKNADTKPKNCEGKTALMIAEEYKFANLTEILRKKS